MAKPKTSYLVRLDPVLFEKTQEAAHGNKKSMNTWIVEALEAKLNQIREVKE